MAHPIRLELPPRDERAELAARLAAAPIEHAEAVLAAYEVLRGLHDQGVLDILRGALGSRDALVEIAAKAADTPEATRGLRNLVLLAQAFGSLDPAVVADFTRAIPAALAQTRAEDARPPGLLALLGTFFSKDFRRGLAAANGLLVAIGWNLSRVHKGTKR